MECKEGQPARQDRGLLRQVRLPPSLSHSRLTNINRSTFLIKEMEHRDALSKNKLFSYLAVRETQLKNLSFVLAVITNMLVIGSYDAQPSARGGSPGDIKV